MTVASRRGRVLLADDDDSVRRPLGLIFRRSGFDVEVVATGHEAARALEREEFNALVADINMPGNEHLELLELCSRHGRLIPVILMTGYPSVETAVGALRRGVVDYVTKPIDPDMLLVRVDAAVAKHRALRALDATRDRINALLEAVDALDSAVSLVGATRVSHPPAAQGGDPLAGLPRDELERLSPRERDVVRLLAVGHTVQDAADALDLSANTIRNHIKSVFAKLRVRSQVALLGKVAGHSPPRDESPDAR